MFHSVTANSIHEAYPTLLNIILSSPDVKIGRVGIWTKEALGIRLCISDVRQNVLVHPVRKLNYRFLLAEWLWITAGRSDVEVVAHYNSQVRKYSDDGVTFAGAYGPRLASQWDYVIEGLKKDGSSRQAVATIWTPNPAKSLDIPCTIACQFLIRRGHLHGIFTMRSSDAWLGIPHDVFTFCQLINMLAGELKAQPGQLILNLGSSHLYETHYKEAQELVTRAEEGETVTSPIMPTFAPYLAEIVLAPPDEIPIPYPWYHYRTALHSGNSQNCLFALRGTCEQFKTN